MTLSLFTPKTTTETRDDYKLQLTTRFTTTTGNCDLPAVAMAPHRQSPGATSTKKLSPPATKKGRGRSAKCLKSPGFDPLAHIDGMFYQLNQLLEGFGKESYKDVDWAFSCQLKPALLKLKNFWEMFISKFIHHSSIYPNSNLENPNAVCPNIDYLATWVCFDLSFIIKNSSGKYQVPSPEVFYNALKPSIEQIYQKSFNEKIICSTSLVLFTFFCMYSNDELFELISTTSILKYLTKVVSRNVYSSTSVYALLAIQHCLELDVFLQLSEAQKEPLYTDSFFRTLQDFCGQVEDPKVVVDPFQMEANILSRLTVYKLQVYEELRQDWDTFGKDVKGISKIRFWHGTSNGLIRTIAADRWYCGTNWQWTTFQFAIPAQPKSSNANLIKFQVYLPTLGSNRIGIGPHAERGEDGGGADLIDEPHVICLDSYQQEVKVYTNANRDVDHPLPYSSDRQTVTCIFNYTDRSVEYQINGKTVQQVANVPAWEKQYYMFISLGTAQRALVIDDGGLIDAQ